MVYFEGCYDESVHDYLCERVVIVGLPVITHFGSCGQIVLAVMTFIHALCLGLMQDGRTLLEVWDGFEEILNKHRKKNQCKV